MSTVVNQGQSGHIYLQAGKILTITPDAAAVGRARCGSINDALTASTPVSYGAYSYQTEWFIDCTDGAITYSVGEQTQDQILQGSGSAVAAGTVDLRGVYDASVNTFPATGGSGVNGAILKGDTWKISVGGTLGSVAVEAGDVITALIDTPAQTAGNWFVTEKNMGYTPENAANKVTSVSGASTDTQYPSAKLAYDQLALKEATANKDATGGYAGLTLFKINFKNAANTITNFFTNATTVARTWTFQDKDGTIADLVDVATKLDHTGKATGAAAAAGEIGEIMTSTIAVGSAVSLTTATPANITSLPLTAGAWEIRAVPDANLGAATITDFQAGISPTTATFGAQDTSIKTPLALTAHTDAYGFPCPTVIVNLAAPTTYYLVASATFSAGAVGGFGTLEARRIAMA